MLYRFSVGQRVKIKSKNPGDLKRMPDYIIGKVGVVKEVRGTFKSPKDHRDDRPPIYSVMFNLSDISSRGSGNEKILVDVFEDWMMTE